MNPVTGWPVVISDVLPIPPTHTEQARRIVRHGLADVLDWLGEDIGPAPDAQLHVMLIDGTMHVSPEAYEHLTAAT